MGKTKYIVQCNSSLNITAISDRRSGNEVFAKYDQRVAIPVDWNTVICTVVDRVSTKRLGT